MDNRLEITLDSNTFTEFKADYDDSLRSILAAMHRHGSDEATITAKMTIKLERDIVPSMKPGEDTREAVIPKFEHKISRSLKIESSVSGMLDQDGTLELVYDPVMQRYVIKPIDDGQQDVYSMVNEESEYGYDSPDA